MRLKLLATALFLTPLMSINLALARNTGNTPATELIEEEVLEEVFVWATKVRSSSITMGAETMSIRQADHISDLLRTIPGVDVGGAHSLNQRITIRSLGDRYLRISIDGANQNSYMYHHMGNLQINSDILHSVDVQVGTNSLVNGGLGGAVRFRTKDPRELMSGGQQFGLRIQGTYATNDFRQYSLTGFGQTSETTDLLGYYYFNDRNNYEVGGGEILDYEGNVIPGTDGRVRGLKGEQQNYLVKGGWDITNNQRLELSYEGYQDEGNYSYRPDMGLATDIAIGESLGLPLTYPTQFSRGTLALNYELEWGETSSLTATVYDNTSELQRDETAINEVWPTDPAQVKGAAENTGLSVLAYSTLGSNVLHQLTYGVDSFNWSTKYQPDGVVASREKSSLTAIFLQDRINFGNGLALIPGIRYDTNDVDSNLVDERYSNLSGSLAVEWTVLDNLLLKLSSTQLFQGPEIAEVFIGAGLNDIANPNIQAQTGANSELSLAFQDEVLDADRFLAGFTLFDTTIDDYIYEYASLPPGVGGRYWKDNIGDMKIKGMEAYVGYDIGGFSSLLTYSHSKSDLSAASGYASLDGARIDREQGDTFSLLLDYVFDNIDVALHWDSLWVSSLPAGKDLDGATLDNAKDGFKVHNISVQWSPRSVERLVLTFGIDNLFDQYYASQSSRTGLSFHPRFGQLQLTDYEPGRNFKATVAYQF